MQPSYQETSKYTW